MEGLSKKDKGMMDTVNSVVIMGWRWWVDVDDGVRGINGNGKINFFKDGKNKRSKQKPKRTKTTTTNKAQTVIK